MIKDCKFFFAFPLALAIILLASSCIVTIPTGSVGIRVLFGKVQDGYLEPGFYMLNPLVRIVKMNIRTQKADEEGVIPSKEMLNMTLKTS